jgi:hypothetical protein
MGNEAVGCSKINRILSQSCRYQGAYRSSKEASYGGIQIIEMGNMLFPSVKLLIVRRMRLDVSRTKMLGYELERFYFIINGPIQIILPPWKSEIY